LACCKASRTLMHTSSQNPACITHFILPPRCRCSDSPLRHPPPAGNGTLHMSETMAKPVRATRPPKAQRRCSGCAPAYVRTTHTDTHIHTHQRVAVPVSSDSAHPLLGMGATTGKGWAAEVSTTNARGSNGHAQAHSNHSTVQLRAPTWPTYPRDPASRCTQKIGSLREGSTGGWFQCPRAGQCIPARGSLTHSLTHTRTHPTASLSHPPTPSPPRGTLGERRCTRGNPYGLTGEGVGE